MELHELCSHVGTAERPLMQVRLVNAEPWAEDDIPMYYEFLEDIFKDAEEFLDDASDAGLGESYSIADIEVMVGNDVFPLSDVISEWVRNHDEITDFANSYGEPGYSLPEGKTCILFANWNGFEKPILDLLEREYELEWSDEWHVDYDNNSKAYRTSANSYFWQCSIHFYGGGVLTPDDSVEDWLEVFMNEPNKALPDWITESQLEELGWEKYNTDRYENGWHPGQTDDPRRIAAMLDETRPSYDYVFRIPEVSQFYLKFDVWIRHRDDGEAS